MQLKELQFNINQSTTDLIQPRQNFPFRLTQFLNAYHNQCRYRKGVINRVPEQSPAREFHSLQTHITHTKKKQHKKLIWNTMLWEETVRYLKRNIIMCSKCGHEQPSCSFTQVRSPQHDGKQSGVKGHILNVPFPAEESFSDGRNRQRRRTTKPFSLGTVLRFMAPQLFIERTCSEEPAKGNKQPWGVITGLKDVFPASSEPSFRTQPSASLSHPDYIRRNPGLRRCLESRAYLFFRAESLSLFSAHFHAPGVPGSIREWLHSIMLCFLSCNQWWDADFLRLQPRF